MKVLRKPVRLAIQELSHESAPFISGLLTQIDPHIPIEALELGQAAGNQRLIGYACCWLSMTCSDLGLFDEGLELAERGVEIAGLLESDHYLYFKSIFL